MKTKKRVNVEYARRRFNKILLKENGWHEAVKLNLVPQNFKNDVDQKRDQIVLNVAEENINVFEKISGQDKQQNIIKKKDLTARESEIRKNRNLQLSQLKSEYQKKLEQIKKDYDEKKSEVKLKASKLISDVRRQRAALKKGETAKKQAGEKMTDSHTKLGKQEKLLDHLIEAVFLQTGDVKLRDAIRAGDVEMLKRLAKERGKK